MSDIAEIARRSASTANGPDRPPLSFKGRFRFTVSKPAVRAHLENNP
jgi:hypothetical protein